MDELVPVIAILTTIGLPIATGLVLGVISMRSKHRERMGLINQGIIPPDTPERKASPNRMVSLRNGIVLMSLGVGISVGYLFWHFVLKTDEDYMFWVLGASVLLFLGLGYLSYFHVTRNMTDTYDRDITE